MADHEIVGVSPEAVKEAAGTIWIDVLIAALDSPVVLLVVAAFLLWKFGSRIINALSTRGIEINWGKGSIKLSELSSNIDQEIDPIKAQLEDLKLELQELKANQGPIEETAESESGLPPNEIIKNRINKALSSSKFRWRSIDSLAKFAGTDKETVLEYLESDAAIVVSVGKNGEQIAKFKHR